MALFPHFTNRRRALQLCHYAVRHGTKVFEKLNRTNIFLARQFGGRTIVCNVCGQRATLWFEMHSVRECRDHKVGHLRETLECLNCLARTRYRLMARGLLTECRERFGIEAVSIAALVPLLGGVTILDTDAFSPIAKIMKGTPGYILSSYMPGQPPGPMAGQDVYNVDLQAICFGDQTFDIILSTDVMEHVRDFDRANREIQRVLKPGGVHVFTVPFADPAATTRILIDTSGDEDVYLEPPQLHGDDHFNGGIPAYRIYGLDLVDNLKVLGFEARIVHVQDAASGIFSEDYLTARRPSAA